MKIYHEPIDYEEIEKRIKKAEEFYKKNMLKMPDLVFKAKTYLPKINTQKGIIDLNEKYKDGIIIADVIGVLPFIAYVSDKLGEVKIFFHEFEPFQVFLCIDPEDRKRIFLSFSKPLKFDERGIL
uniref:Uncharacterized protein n=1 Tax=candidate division WOR-3 bacterium TaxID=2052148 RepID=A0A7V3ZSW3_UNCW3